MSKAELDTREVMVDVLLGMTGATQSSISFQPPALLGRRLWVFQVPSATTPNYVHFIVGSPSSGWRCSCTGFQAHGSCYHVNAVVMLFEELRADAKAARKKSVRKAARKKAVRGSRRRKVRGKGAKR